MSNHIRQRPVARSYPCEMATKDAAAQAIDPVRLGVGMRLAAAREDKKMTQDNIAKRFSINKGTVSAWETGRGDPGIYRLKELAKLYDVSADALLWEDSLTRDAMKVAAQFDELNEKQKGVFYAIWEAYVRTAVTDQQVEERMPITKQAPGEPKTLEYGGPERRNS